MQRVTHLVREFGNHELELLAKMLLPERPGDPEVVEQLRKLLPTHSLHFNEALSIYDQVRRELGLEPDPEMRVARVPGVIPFLDPGTR